MKSPEKSPDTQSSPLSFRLFGRFEANKNGQPIAGLHLREGERILAYLLIRAPEVVPTRELAKRFWPSESGLAADGTDTGYFPNVRQALSNLRGALGTDAERLVRDQPGLFRFDVTDLSVDLLDFDNRARIVAEDDGGQAARQAIALYRGPLLADWNDKWVVDARRLRQRRYGLLLRQLALRAREERNTDEEERWTRLLLDVEPGDEETVRSLLRLLSASGRQMEALAALTLLQETLSAAKRTPTSETVELAEELRRRREAHSGNPSAVPNGEPPGGKSEILLRNPAAVVEELAIEPAGGAVPIDSPFYVERAQDAQFHAALRRHDSVVLLKGARQVGKTSLLARGLQKAREADVKVVMTDFQQLNAAQLSSPDAFYRALATLIARQLEIAFSVADWEDDDAGPNLRMEQFLKYSILPQFPNPLVWAIDEADRLFTCPFGGEVFALFRSWHNARALNPTTEFRRLTLAVSYATEAQLFITDLNQSPFNVGTRLSLADFTTAEVSDLNSRYGAAALLSGDLASLEVLVGGQPYLLRCALNEVAQGTAIADILARADGDDGIFSDHLRHLWSSVERSPDLLPILQALSRGEGAPTPNAFYRLRAAGILAGHSPQDARYRCRLYSTFFSRQLAYNRGESAAR